MNGSIPFMFQFRMLRECFVDQLNCFLGMKTHKDANDLIGNAELEKGYLKVHI